MGTINSKTLLEWALRILIAAAMVYYGSVKLIGIPESVELFRMLGLGDWFRYVTGCIEITAALLLLIPRTGIFGALLTTGTMAGAFFSHLTILGFEGEIGMLAIFGLVIMALALMLAFIRRRDLPFFGKN